MRQANLQYRVPVDDEHTLHVTWFFYKGAPGTTLPDQGSVPDEKGGLIPDLVNHQDFLAWITQGPNADRTVEKLGESDRGIILLRKQLKDQLAIVADGGDPINVFRDPQANERIELPLERWPSMNEPARFATYTSPQAGESQELKDQVQRVLSGWAEHAPV